MLGVVRWSWDARVVSLLPELALTHCISFFFKLLEPIAEDYHQDYYINNPLNYGYYKNACRRPQRLKEVWGEEEYTCYHEEVNTCFINDSNVTATASGFDDGEATVVNADGEVVAAESNIKMVGAETAGLMPRWATILVSILGALVAGALLYLAYIRWTKTKGIE